MLKTLKLLLHPRMLLIHLMDVFAFLFPDKLYLQIEYWLRMGKPLPIDNPKTFNEKLQWLKLYNRKPIYSKMVDKIDAKDYVANIIGPEYIIPTLATYDDVEEINWNLLPNQFVIKCSHDSGSIVVCKEKSKLDIEEANNKLKQGLKTNFYLQNREWPYKNVKPRLLVEKFMYEEGGLIDYKFYCFNGKAYKVMMCLDRASGHPKFYSFDREWNLLRHNKLGKAAPEGFTLRKPGRIDEMFDIAEQLSKDIPFLRVDLYCVDNMIYFGEMTFYPNSGYDFNILPEIDKLYGSMIHLPKK